MRWLARTLFLAALGLALGMLAPLARAGGALQSLRFEHLGPEQTGVQATLMSAQQDSRGLMWLGTSEGLLRYDGRRGKLFPSDLANPASLSHPAVRAMLLLPDERMLLGTERGLDEIDLHTERVRRHGLPGERHMRERYVLGLQPAGAGKVWVLTPINLLQFDTAQRRFRDMPLPPLQTAVAGRPAQLWAMRGDGLGGIWLAAGQELLHLDGSGHPLQRWPLQAFDSTAPGVRDLTLDREGHVWLGTNSGVRVVEAASGRQLDWPQRLGLPALMIHTMFTDHAGSVWIGSGGAGLWRWRPGSTAAEQFIRHPALPDSIGARAPASINQDRSGVLWVGAWDGTISLVDLDSGGFHSYRSVFGEADSLSSDGVMAVQAEGTEHAWAATYGGGLNRVHLASGRTERIGKDQLPMPYQKALMLQAGRGLWVGGDGGIFLLELPGRRVRRIDLAGATGGGTSISSFALDGRGNVWAGSAGGVYRIAPDGQLRRFRREAGRIGSLSNEVVDCLLADAEGRLWAGSKGGLQLWDERLQGFVQPVLPSADLSQPADLIVFALRQDARGQIWVGSQQGLYQLLPAVGQSEGWQLKAWNKLPGMPRGWIHGLENAPDGSLWMASSEGLSRLDPNRQSLHSYAARSGHFPGNFVQGASHAGPDGSLLYGGEGLLHFKPTELRDNATPPPLVLADIRIFNRSMLDGSTDALPAGGAASSLKALGIEGPLAQARSLRLSHREAMVSFDLRALHYYSPKQIRYAWRLAGFDPDWIHGPPGEGLATYTNLDPGHYRLLAKAANPDGRWSEPQLLLEIEVLPPWWRSGWLRLLLAMALLLLLGTAWRLRLRSLQREQLRLEQQVEKRTAEVQAQRQQIATLSDIGRELTASLDVAAIHHTLNAHVEALMPATIFGVGLLRRDEGVIEFDYVLDRGRPCKPYRRSLAATEQPAARCVNHDESLILSSFAHDNRQLDARVREREGGQQVELLDGGEPSQAGSGLYVPLRLKGQVIGVISVLSEQADAYTQTHLDMLQTLGAYAAVALDNADAYRQLKQTQTQLFAQEKLAALGSLVAGVAHELNTPLGNSLLAASTLHDSTLRFAAAFEAGALRRSELQAFCEMARGSTDLLLRGLSSATSLVASFKQLAVDQTSERRREFDLRQLCEEVALSLINRLRKDSHELRLELPAGLLLDSYPGPLGQVLSNLVLNALTHGFEGRQGGVIRIDAERLPGDQLRLRFADDGCGIPEQHLSRVFDPFFTTKLGSGGSGLGLHLCYTIVHSMLGGEISVSSAAGQGAVFELLLPLVAPRQAEHQPPA